MRVLLAVAAVVLLAGCAGPASPEPEAMAGDTEGRTARPSDLQEVDGRGRFEATFRLTVNPDDAPLVAGGETCLLGQCRDFRDCVQFHSYPKPPSFMASNITAELVWRPPENGFGESLVLSVGGTEVRSVAGPSPLAIQVPSLAPRELAPSFWFAVDDEPPQPPVLQEVELWIAFDYQGALPAPEPASCQWG